MKKFFSILIASVMLMFSAIVSVADANDVVTIYAPDGRSSLVLEYEIDYYRNLGWYPYPVITMYSADGRETIVRPEETEYYQGLGWYTNPVVTLYNTHGETNLVFEYEVEYYQKLGWYTQPVDMLNKEYYPGTTIPTFDSVTGMRLTKKENTPDGGTLYSYKFRTMPEAENWFVYNDYLLDVAGCTFISGKVAYSDDHALIGLYTKGESGIFFGIDFDNEILFVIPLE